MTDLKLETASVQVPIDVKLPNKKGIPNETSLQFIRSYIENTIPYPLINWYLNTFNTLKIVFDIRTDQISRELIELLHRDIFDLISNKLTYE